ncbi:hypothetical protein TVAG_445100 [Trichomonas vaginalis G3]|uniref:Beige/BEACH domain containing protein n=1 Tax=Trichomonas vaginalis (strain ATCC PRA-98 / G3) TaxID=412133 RepID=A2E4H7_TRIV3|nr:aggrephagy protein [Trichomonas vaginalis G3]EAY12399.1 hypothetical protein TVAG_445100 [Trichomonas vaginalis G3]KAI5494162.1 aggrephagy protein [Trichomonas vaginalis G3]|eukprot:XP_001324622.1 hypothetical protein [Trichomonas vaginalis G3]
MLKNSDNRSGSEKIDDFTNFFYSTYTSDLPTIPKEYLDNMPENVKSKYSKQDTRSFSNKSDFIDSLGLSDDIDKKELELFLDFSEKIKEKNVFNLLNRIILRVDRNILSILSSDNGKLVFADYPIFTKYFQYISECNQKNIKSSINDALLFVHSILQFLIPRMENKILQSYIISILKTLYQLYNKSDFDYKSNPIFTNAFDFIDKYFTIDSKNLSEDFIIQLIDVLDQSKGSRTIDQNALISIEIIRFFSTDTEVLPMSGINIMFIKFALEQIIKFPVPPKIVFEKEFILTVVNIMKHFLPTVEMDAKYDSPVTNYSIEDIDETHFDKKFENYHSDLGSNYSLPKQVEFNINPLLNDLVNPIINYIKKFEESQRNVEKTTQQKKLVPFNMFIDQFDTDIDINNVILLIVYMLDKSKNEGNLFIYSYGFWDLINPKVFGETYSSTVRNAVLRLSISMFFNPSSKVPESILQIISIENFFHFWPLFKELESIKGSQEFIKSLVFNGLFAKLADFAIDNMFIYDYLRYFIYKFPKICFSENLVKSRMLTHSQTFIKLVKAATREQEICLKLKDILYDSLKCKKDEITAAIMGIIGTYSNLDFNIDLNDLMTILVQEVKKKNLYLEFINLLANLAYISSKYRNQLFEMDEKTFDILVDCDYDLDLTLPLIHCSIGDIDQDIKSEDFYSNPIVFKTAIAILIRRCKYTKMNLEVTKELNKLSTVPSNAEKILLANAYDFTLENMKNTTDKEEFKVYLKLFELLSMSQFTPSMYQKLIKTIEAKHYLFANLVFEVIYKLIIESKLTREWSFVFSENGSQLVDENVQIKQDTTIAFSISNMKIDSKHTYPLFLMKNDKTEIKMSFAIKENCSYMYIDYDQSVKNILKFERTYFDPNFISNVLIIFNLPKITININKSQKTINILEPKDEENESQEEKPAKPREKTKSPKKQEFQDADYTISFASFLNNSILDCSISDISLFHEIINVVPEDPLLMAERSTLYRKYSPRCVVGDKIEFIDQKDNKKTAKFNGIISFGRSTIFRVLNNADYLYSLVPVVQNYCDRDDSTNLESDQNDSIAVILLRIFKIMLDSDDALCTSFYRNDYFKYFASFLSKLKSEFVDTNFLTRAVDLMDTKLSDKIAVAFFLNIDFAKNISRVPKFIENYAMKCYQFHKTSFFNREALVIYYGGVLEMPSQTTNNKINLDGRQEFLNFALQIISDEEFKADKSFLITYPMWNDKKGFEEAVKLIKEINIFKDIESSISNIFLPWIYMLNLPDLHIFALDKFIEYFNKYSKDEKKKSELVKLSIIASLNFNSILDKEEDINKYREIFIQSSITIPLLLKILSFTIDKERAMKWLIEQLRKENISQNFIECMNWQYFLLDFMCKINKINTEPFILILQRNPSHITTLFRLIESFYINHKSLINWEKLETDILLNLPKDCFKGHLNEILSLLVPLIMHDFEIVSNKNVESFPLGNLRECMDYLIKLPAAVVKTDREETSKDKTLLQFTLDLLDYYDGKSVTIYEVKFDMILLFIDLLYEYSKFGDDIEEYFNKIINWLSHNPMNVQLLGISNIKEFYHELPPRLEKYYRKDIEPCRYFYDRLDNDKFSYGFFKAVERQRSDIFRSFELLLNKDHIRITYKDDLLKSCMKHSYDHYYNDYLVSTKYRSEEFHNANLKDLENYFKTNGTLLFESKDDFKPTFVVSSFINRKGGRSLMEPRSRINDITHFYQNDEFEFPKEYVKTSAGFTNNCIAVTIEGYYQGKISVETDTKYIKFNGSTKTNCHFYFDLNINEIEFIFNRICFGRDVACEIYSSFKPPLYLILPCEAQRDTFISFVAAIYDKDNERIPRVEGKFDLFTELRKAVGGNIYNPNKDFTKIAQTINLQSRWASREISTFTYISYLSILGGRSYNNTMEYPFFPFIFQNYKDRDLRDLTKTTSLETQRQSNIDTAENIGFSKGCSSGLSVILDFVRCYPFYAQQYDYSSKGYEYYSRSFTIFKLVEDLECLPEFFCFPYIFVDTLGLPLFKNERGELLHEDVILPDWAKTKENMSLTNAMKFVSLHRYYLETRANEHINIWFDIMYGNKRGNHTYGEFNNVDSKKLGRNFGDYLKYIPTDRVFESSHIQREDPPNDDDMKEETYTSNIIYFNKKVVITESGTYKYNDAPLNVILQNRAIVGVWPDSNTVLYLSEKSKSQSFVILHRVKENSLSFVCHQSSNITCACVAGRRILVTGGFYGDVNIWSLPGRALIRSFSYHVSQIVKVAMSADCGLIASLDQENNLVFCTIDRKFICKLQTDAEIGLFVYKSGIVCAVGKNKITFYNSVGNVLSTVELKETIVRAKKCVFYSSIDAIAVSYRVNNSDSIKVFNAAGEELTALAQVDLEINSFFEYNKKGTILTVASGTKVVKFKKRDDNKQDADKKDANKKDADLIVDLSINK